MHFLGASVLRDRANKRNVATPLLRIPLKGPPNLLEVGHSASFKQVIVIKACHLLIRLVCTPCEWTYRSTGFGAHC